METTQSQASPPRYRLGDADLECHYPVLVGDQYIGRIFRWHGAWRAVAAGSDDEVRVAEGRIGKNAAALYLVDEADAGRIAPLDEAESVAQAPALYGPVPLLHWRLPATDSNKKRAQEVMDLLAVYRWWPKGGYSGSDNPMFLECELCGKWRGPRYWSHLRGRNNQPPSPFRHPGGCIGADKVRASIPAYQQQPEVNAGEAEKTASVSQ
ncbi:hypothetical protein [Streptomyces phaeochromogenes]